MYSVVVCLCVSVVFFFQAEDGIRDLVRSRGLGDVYKRQEWYDSGGGLGGGGFGSPEENGYTVKAIVEKDEFSDTLLFRNFINDTLTKQGKVIFLFFQNNPSAVSYTHLTLPTSDLV